MEDKSMSEKLNDMIKQSLSSIKDMVSCDTIMGTPMHMPQGTTIIPISKGTVGYASGGLDYFSKSHLDLAAAAERELLFLPLDFWLWKRTEA